MRTWGEYARYWLQNRNEIPIENEDVVPQQRLAYLTALGDEWGTKKAVDQFVADYALPFVNNQSVVLEIGAGGGRVVHRMAPHCAQLISFDVEPEMMRLCEDRCKHLTNVSYVLGSKVLVAIPIAGESIDFVYSFDTLVHLDQRTICRYLLEIGRVLRPTGVLTLHTATHETKLGWQHFMNSITGGVTQGQFGSFEYLESTSLFRISDATGFQLIKTTLGDKGGNFYYDRDLICSFCKKL